MKGFDSTAALDRIPRWMLLLTCLAVPVVFWRVGMGFAWSFAAGALLGYVNFRIIRRAVEKLTGTATGKTGTWLFIQFAALVLAAFGILLLSGMNVTSALFGFLVCQAAAVAELLYELTQYGHP